MQQADLAQMIYNHLQRIRCSRELVTRVMRVINGKEQDFDWLVAAKSPKEVDKSV